MIEDARRQIVQYLQRYPGEELALHTLVRQIEEDEGILERHNMRGHITTSAFVLNHERTLALMIHHNHHNLWLQPGGHYEGTDSLQASALREVEEETGVRFVTLIDTIPIDIDTHPISARPAKGEGEHFHHDFLYLGVAPQKVSLSPQLEEVGGVQWLSLDELEGIHSRMSRIVPKVRARIR